LQLPGCRWLGDLRRQPFEEIFAGATAQEFRRKLSLGRLPVDRCAVCFHLRTVPAPEAEVRRTQFRLPKGLSVENTSLCNLRCRSCCRREILESRSSGHSLSLDDVTVVGQTLARLGAEYCGYYNLGEPFFSRSIRSELEILRKYCPNIRILTSTNGLLVDCDDRREAALLLDEILFSIDGINTPMVRRYQRGGDFERSYENLKALVAYRNRRRATKPRIVWKYVVFRWNDRRADIERAIALARQAGADAIQFFFARNPAHAISLPFLFSRYFRRLGRPRGWRCRVVELSAERVGSD
jgi:MoaA/NifB/PqqE/SkfB family radical SAM enzyme